MWSITVTEKNTVNMYTTSMLAAIHNISQRSLTIISNVRYLEPFGTVCFISFEIDPQLAGAGGESYWPFIGLASLVCCD